MQQNLCCGVLIAAVHSAAPREASGRSLGGMAQTELYSRANIAAPTRTVRNSDDEQDLLTVGEVAERLGYTPQHVRLLLREGRLDGTKIGRDWVVSVGGVRDFLARRETLNLPFDEKR